MSQEELCSLASPVAAKAACEYPGCSAKPGTAEMLWKRGFRSCCPRMRYHDMATSWWKRVAYGIWRILLSEQFRNFTPPIAWHREFRKRHSKNKPGFRNRDSKRLWPSV